MTTTQYIILRNSVEQAAYEADPLVFQGKKFKPIMLNYKPLLRSSDEESETIGGYLKVSPGYVFYVFNGTIRCPQALTAAETANHFGTYGDLKAYFLLRNPNGTPSNVITLVDHYGVEHTGFLRGNFEDAPMTTILEGTEANYLIPILFKELQAVA